MLASTVQFSKNNQTPPHYCQRLPDQPGGSKTDRTLSFLAEENTHVFSQDPTAYRTLDQAPTRPFHAPEGTVLTRAATRPNALASIHIIEQPPTDHSPTAWLSTDNPKEVDEECSLERR